MEHSRLRPAEGAAAAESAHRLCKPGRLESVADRKANTYSGGQRCRLNIALDMMRCIRRPLCWFRTANFDPVCYAVEGARALMNGQPNAAVVYQAFLALIPVTALVLWSTIRSYRTVVS